MGSGFDLVGNLVSPQMMLAVMVFLAAGTLAFSISALARSFKPMARIALAGGPTKVMPAFAHASANSAFSDRKP